MNNILMPTTDWPDVEVVVLIGVVHEGSVDTHDPGSVRIILSTGPVAGVQHVIKRITF